MLIKTIRMETEDGSVFSKDAPLLAAASELAFHTINCSALNAEELRRESGMEVRSHEIRSKSRKSLSLPFLPPNPLTYVQNCRQSKKMTDEREK